MTQMKSPKRKLQKKNDYQRHKLFRKIKRRRKAQVEAEQQIAEKQLRRKLKLPKFGDGKEVDAPTGVKPRPFIENEVVRENVDLDSAHIDEEGYLVDNTTGVKYTPIAKDIEIRPDTRYYRDPYVGASNYFDGNWAKDLISFIPVIGDCMDAEQVIVDYKNGKYQKAATGLAMLALPRPLSIIANVIQKIWGDDEDDEDDE